MWRQAVNEMGKRRVAKLLGILYKPKLKATYYVVIYARLIICCNLFIYFAFVLYATGIEIKGKQLFWTTWSVVETSVVEYF